MGDFSLQSWSIAIGELLPALPFQILHLALLLPVA
jgi:hypothetical protein